jgi:hypothetical protein
MIILLASGGVISVGLLFWLLMILSLIFQFWLGWPISGTANGWRPLGGSLLLWILLALLGIQVFGWPVGA